MKLPTTQAPVPVHSTVVAALLAEPRDSRDGSIPLSAFARLPAGECLFHQAMCGGPERHATEIKRAIHAFNGIRIDHLLRYEPEVAAGPTPNSHVIYFKLDIDGITYRVGAMRDLVAFDDYADDTGSLEPGRQSIEPLRILGEADVYRPLGPVSG